MIMKDAVTNLLLVTDRFITKRGQDIDVRKDMISAINTITGEDSLDAIYVNNVDNFMVPDVAVLQLYHHDFAKRLLDSDDTDTCPYGYTIEINQRCFTKYTAEELAAAILHDILQNVQSDTAKIRFMKAYNAVSSRHGMADMMTVVEDNTLSEIVYIMFTQICLRPFRVPVMGFDYVATDEVLRTMGLGDAYDSYLEKALPVSNNTPEEVMVREMNDDVRDMNTVINACLDKTIRRYYSTVREASQLISLNNVLGDADAFRVVGFKARKRDYKRKCPMDQCAESSLLESYNSPRTELELRFQIDKIISSLRYAETEAEREVLLFRIKQLTLKVVKNRMSLETRLNDKFATEKIKVLRGFEDELEELRKKVIDKEIKVKRWSVYIKDEMPEGYDF